MTDTTVRVHELNLYWQYFDLVAAGTKTIEVRVQYPHLADLSAGDTIRIRIKGIDETCKAKVKRVPSTPTSRPSLMAKVQQTSTQPPHGSSSSPTFAPSTQRRKPSAHWPSRSDSLPNDAA